MESSQHTKASCAHILWLLTMGTLSMCNAVRRRGPLLCPIEHNVFAPAIGVDRAVEGHIGRLVEGQDRLRPFLGHRGAQFDRRTIQRLHMIAPVAIDLPFGQPEAGGDQSGLRSATFDRQMFHVEHLRNKAAFAKAKWRGKWGASRGLEGG